jgi:UDP-glucose 4-epimerase
LQAASGRRKSISVFGRDYATEDGTCIRDYIHIQDLCSAHALALDHLQSGRGQGALAFNLGNGQGFSVQEVIETAQAVVGQEGYSVLVEEGQRRAGDPAVLVADASRAKTALGWTPVFIDLKTIIQHAWQWEKRLAKL